MMNIRLNIDVAEGYKSKSQAARVFTELWVAENMFCPRCGAPFLNHLRNNAPVADFSCPSCGDIFELKSKSGSLPNKIPDGAYDTMISRITGNTNPDFLFMTYSPVDFRIEDLILIPNYFFVPEIIEKRKPLADTARRSGWVGCNVLIGKIPNQGRIPIISDGFPRDKSAVVADTTKLLGLKVEKLSSRGWLFDVLNCVNEIESEDFTLDDAYRYVDVLAAKHPDNHNVEAKIRQQLQLLRNKGYIEFVGRGKYKKI